MKLDLADQGLWSYRLELNGLTDPGYLAVGASGNPLHNRGNHSIGMAIDLGVGQWINDVTQRAANPSDPILDVRNFPSLGWSVSNAVTLSGLLPNTLDRFGGPLNNQRQALRDFLALYAVTRNDGIVGNGTWDDLSRGLLVNPGAQAALFGDGSEAGGLISHVLIGDSTKNLDGTPRAKHKNPYNGIREVLFGLGIDSLPSTDHQNHFHITLRTPVIKPIDPPTQYLLAENAVPGQTETGTSEALRAAAQALLDEVQPQLGFDQGEFTMFVMDMPDVPPQYAPVVIAQKSQTQPGSAKTERTIGVCHLIENQPESRLSAVNSMGPVLEVWGYLKREGVTDQQLTLEMYNAAKFTVLQMPEHGELGIDENTQSARYFPTSPDYRGPDRATVLVEMGGYKVKVLYFFNVLGGAPSGTEGYDPHDDKIYCPQGKGSVWKISLNPDDPSAPIYTFQHPYQLTSYIAGAVDVGITLADLTDGAVGQTTGTTITLDTNAAGHGWFIDSTPGSNEEWLPTHNPNEWIAKEGSDAFGKMDMLSVLLHEYGHVLGIDHSANGHDLMATTLTPGMRRMPTTDELALMADLVADLKADLQASSAANSVTTNSSDSPLPFPWLPLDSTLGLAFLGRLRGRLSGLASNDAALTPALSQGEREVVQYAVVANATLENGTLDAPQGWLSQGNVAFANGAAVLNEVSASQTRLSQVFMIGKEGNT